MVINNLNVTILHCTVNRSSHQNDCFFNYFTDERNDPLRKDFFKKLNEYVNFKLLERIEFVLSKVEDEPENFLYCDLFPQFYVERNGFDLCMSRLRGFERMVDSELPYYVLPPSLLFILYHVLLYAEGEDREFQKSFPEESLFEENEDENGDEINSRVCQLSKELRKIISESNANTEFKELYEEYKAFDWESVYNIFDDGGDYTPLGLEILVAQYARIGGNQTGIIDGINLNDCVDIMEEHSRLLFESVQREQEKKSILGYDSLEDYIVSSLQYCIIRLQTKLAYLVNENEVMISDRMADILSGCLFEKCIMVDREVHLGRAIKNLGETDIVLSYKDGLLKRYLPIAIIENKVIEKFSSQYLQLMGYLNHDFQFGMTVSINRHMKLDDAVSFIRTSLAKIEGPFRITGIDDYKGRVCTIKSTHLAPETGREMTVYHFVLNLNDKERRESALKARSHHRI